MFKKLLATFIGATGVFGFSIEKHLNIFSSGDVIPKPSAGGGGTESFLCLFKLMLMRWRKMKESLLLLEDLKKEKVVCKITGLINEKLKARDLAILSI
ncbi:hypothetical protein MSUIS_04940 [Mycoplasma suis KI3806]|uniref:Uncharacterized protein n=1 Tax=Mycoplasma suis (strain KI_3806) TaxID=708248 RepID=F0V1Q6_MYCS3|nr:hypothetical protein MSUIS_04940 [Mycoplasma suis KI3806]